MNHLEGHYKLMASVMYGSGLRLSEVSRLIIQDIDFANNCIVVRETKRDAWRRTLLPNSIEQPLERQIFFALQLHEQDIDDGFGKAYLPNALNRKYPNAPKKQLGNTCSPPIIYQSTLDPTKSVDIILVFSKYNVALRPKSKALDMPSHRPEN